MSHVGLILPFVPWILWNTVKNLSFPGVDFREVFETGNLKQYPPTWMSQEVSKRLGNGLYLLINGIYMDITK